MMKKSLDHLLLLKVEMMEMMMKKMIEMMEMDLQVVKRK
jgi:hypothetical protein